MAAARDARSRRTAPAVVPNSIMCRRMIVAKYTGCGNQPNGTSRFCFNDCAACTSPGPARHRAALRRPRDREHVEHVARLALARSPRRRGTGAVAAHAMPPPHGDVHMSCDVPKCSWNAATSKSANAPDHVRPSMSSGSSPASAIARSTASAPISRAVRPDAFVYAVSPMPDDRDLVADVVELGCVAPVASPAENVLVERPRLGCRSDPLQRPRRARHGMRLRALHRLYLPLRLRLRLRRYDHRCFVRDVQHAARRRVGQPNDRAVRARPPAEPAFTGSTTMVQ